LWDAWWDAKKLCIVTKADQEMANILAFKTDLIFLETKVELDMSGATTPDSITKIQDGLLLAGLISTFRTTITCTTKTTQKPAKMS